jgi:hypothetical protein
LTVIASSTYYPTKPNKKGGKKGDPMRGTLAGLIKPDHDFLMKKKLANIE